MKRSGDIREVRFTTAQELAYNRLKAALISGAFYSGERLLEQDLAERLGLSRTPVREAFKRLENEGFLVRTPHRGVIVRKFTLKEAKNIYEVRMALEGLAAGLAAKMQDRNCLVELGENLNLARQALAEQDLQKLAELNNSFHSILVTASGNEMLEEMLLNLRGAISLLRIYTWTIPGRPALTVMEHERILDAIKAGDTLQAQKMAAEHISTAWGFAERVLQKNLKEF